MRCLLVAPARSDLAAVRQLLVVQNIEVATTTQIGTGASLARASLEDFDFALAVVPTEASQRPPIAVFVELGIVLGRELPVFMIITGDGIVPAGLEKLDSVRTSLTDPAPVELHLRLFIEGQRLGHPKREAVSRTTSALSATSIAQYRNRLSEARLGPISGRAIRVERLVVDLLREGGTLVEESPPVDNDIDAALLIPGAEQTVGSVLVEIKSQQTISTGELNRLQLKLQDIALQRQSGLGLLLLDLDGGEVPTHQITPLVLVLSIDHLLTELEHASLASVLVEARNVAVHSM